MAKVVSTYTNAEGHEIAVYESGAERDTVTRRLVKPATHTLITAENSTALHRERQELKRARLLAGAARTLDRSGDWTTPNDLDVVEALGEAVMMKALNPDNVKQVDAARFILQESGLADRTADGDTPPSALAAAYNAGQADALARIYADVLRLHERQSAEVVDSEVKE